MKRFTRQSTQRAAPSRLSLGTKVSNAPVSIFAGRLLYSWRTTKGSSSSVEQRAAAGQTMDDVGRRIAAKAHGRENLIWPIRVRVCVLPVLPARRWTKIEYGEGRRERKRRREREREMEKHMSPLVRLRKVWGRSIDEWEWLTLRFLSRTIGWEQRLAGRSGVASSVGSTSHYTRRGSLISWHPISCNYNWTVAVRISPGWRTHTHTRVPLADR